MKAERSADLRQCFRRSMIMHDGAIQLRPSNIELNSKDDIIWYVIRRPHHKHSTSTWTSSAVLAQPCQSFRVRSTCHHAAELQQPNCIRRASGHRTGHSTPLRELQWSRVSIDIATIEDAHRVTLGWLVGRSNGRYRLISFGLRRLPLHSSTTIDSMTYNDNRKLTIPATR